MCKRNMRLRVREFVNVFVRLPPGGDRMPLVVTSGEVRPIGWVFQGAESQYSQNDVSFTSDLV